MSKHKNPLILIISGVTIFSLTSIFLNLNTITYLEPTEIYQKIDKIEKNPKDSSLRITMNNGKIYKYKHKLSKPMIRNLSNNPINNTHCYQVIKRPYLSKFAGKEVFYEYSLSSLNYADNNLCEVNNASN